MLLQTPAADGLFAKGINMSGNLGPAMANSKGDGEELAIALMAELGIDGNVKELEAAPYDRLAEAYRRIKPEFAAAGKYLGCASHPNAFYRGNSEEYGVREETVHIPMLVGTVYGEFFAFIASKYDKHKLTYEEGTEIVKRELGEEAVAELLPLYMSAYPELNLVDILTY